MQLMDKTELLNQPAQTIFSRFDARMLSESCRVEDIQPVAFGDLCLKGETRGTDFEYVLPDDDISGGSSLLADLATINRYRRNFERDATSGSTVATTQEELFVVWNRRDVRDLARRITRARNAFSLPALLATVDEFAVRWVSVEDSAATS